MKKQRAVVFILLFVLFTGFSALAAGIPEHTRDFYVNDFAGVLSDETSALILGTGAAMAEKTGAQIVVVTVDSLNGDSIEEYALSLLRTWGIGDEKKNNGVLLLVAVNDRKSRIEVGYGLEGCLPDGKTGRIQDDYMLPYFREEDYDAGVKNGYLAILKEVAQEYSVDVESLGQDIPMPEQTDDSQEASDGMGQLFLVGAAILFFLFDWIFLRGRITRALILMSGRGGGGGFGGSGGGGFGGGGFSGGGGSGGGGGSSRGW